MTENETQDGLGPSRGYCPPSGGIEPHHMVSRSAGEMVRWVEICSRCGWIDADALDEWARNAIKVNTTENAQNIAIASGTKPFAFVQREEDGLTLDEVLGQALGAASMCWEHPERAGVFNASRAKEIWFRLRAEVLRFQRIAAEESALKVEPDLKNWTDLGADFYALACNSRSLDPAHQERWSEAFERFKSRFHEMLPVPPETDSGA